MTNIQIEKIQAGIEKYKYLRKRLYEVNVFEDKDFRRVFNNFFRMGRRTATYYDDYYHYFEKHKQNTISYKDALTYFYERHHRLEMSFVSKMAALVNPEYPIWDSVVALGHFGMKAPYANANNRLQKAVERYERYCKAYYAYMQSSDGQERIKVFEKHFPSAEISVVKKMDFILWQER